MRPYKRSRKRRIILSLMVIIGLIFLGTALDNKQWESTKDIPGLLGIASSKA